MTATDGLTFADLDVEGWRLVERAGLSALAASALSDDPSMQLGLPDSTAMNARWGALTHLRTLADLRFVAATLESVGVRWLVFKGPVLADIVYRHRAARIYGDLDILVHPEDLERALDALLLDGSSTLLDRNWQRILQTQQSELSILLPHGTALDLHWHVISSAPTRRAFALPVSKLFEAAIAVRIGGITVRTFSELDTLCYVCLHAALSGGHRLRWLVDIQQTYLWAHSDPDRLAERAEMLGCSLVLRVMLSRAARHVDPRLWESARRAGRPSGWSVICDLVDRTITLDPDENAYSGRALFSSTRRTTGKSVAVSVSAGVRALRAGRARRCSTLDPSILRQDLGAQSDRAAWFAIARTHS